MKNNTLKVPVGNYGLELYYAYKQNMYNQFTLSDNSNLGVSAPLRNFRNYAQLSQYTLPGVSAAPFIWPKSRRLMLKR